LGASRVTTKNERISLRSQLERMMLSSQGGVNGLNDVAGDVLSDTDDNVI
jgi:hypothetical protein